MPDRPFLNDPDPAGTLPAGDVPAALFDLAVNRAAAALRGLRPADPALALAQWHARTRFARRVPLAAVSEALRQKPPEPGEWHWTGGPGGDWREGKAPFP